MKELTILGAGLSTQSFIERFRAKNSEAKVTIVEKEEFYFDKSRLISQPDNSKDRLAIAEWAADKGCEFIRARAERINSRRKKLYLKNREPINFEALIIATGLDSRKIEAKGQHREGFFYLSDIDLFKLKDLLKISNDVCVGLSTFLGIRLGLALRALGKEVFLVAANLDFLAEDKERVREYLKDRGIALYLDCEIQEAVGESMIKAVKINPLKVFSSQLVFIDSGFIPARNFFEEEVRVADNFFGNQEDIYFIGDAAANDISRETFFGSHRQQAINQGRIFADYLLDKQPPLFQKESFYPEDRSKIIYELIGGN